MPAPTPNPGGESGQLRAMLAEAIARRDATVPQTRDDPALSRVRADLAGARRALHEWREVAEYAFHLGQYGECAPGGNETWQKCEQMIRIAASRSSSSERESDGTHEHRWACETCDARRDDPVQVPPELLALAATEAVTEPETRRWSGHAHGGCRIAGSERCAEHLVEWINANGGEARYEPGSDATSISVGRDTSRIVITGPNGDRVMAPGDVVVKGEMVDRWPEDWHDHPGGVFREFTVRRPTPEETT